MSEPAGKVQHRRHGWASLLPILGILPFAYTVYFEVANPHGWLQNGFSQSLMSNMLATAVGVILGIPIALWANSELQRRAEQRQTEIDAAYASTQHDRILAVIDQELQGNLPALSELEAGDVSRIYFPVARWRAICASGELKWIDDLLVLDSVAQAYESLESINALAAHWLSATAARSITGETELSDVLTKLISDAAGDSIAKINAALPHVNAIAVEAPINTGVAQ